MSNKKEALGKGIRALLQNIDAETEGRDPEAIDDKILGITVARLPLDQIEVNPFQPRADFEEASLKELADSIKVHGVIQPITVRALSNKKYQLIAGERRLRATQAAGLTEIPAYIRKANDQEMLEIGLVENIQREDLNAMEIAINYKRLMDECSLKQEELAERVGKERTTVTNYLRLLKLPPEIQKGIKMKELSMGHARALIGMDNVASQLALYKEIKEKGLSVRNVEALVRDFQKPGPSRSSASKSSLSPELRKIEEALKMQLGTKVAIKTRKAGAGEIVISYFSNDDLSRILDLIEKD